MSGVEHAQGNIKIKQGEGNVASLCTFCEMIKVKNKQDLSGWFPVGGGRIRLMRDGFMLRGHQEHQGQSRKY